MGRLMRNIATQPGVKVGSNLNVASGLFIDHDYPVKQLYKEQAMRIYNTEVYTMNFTGDGYGTANFINQ
jgi:serine protease inhibitor